MSIPIHRMKKADILALNKMRCEAHGVPYLQHPNCWRKEVVPNERVGFLDIESSNLTASFGVMICYCILDDQSDMIYKDQICKKELFDKTVRDRRVIESLCRDIRRFDTIITFYGTKFDVPFCRTRALVHGLDFPEFGEVRHKDVYYMVKSKLRLHSNRLEAACNAVFGHSAKTGLSPAIWVDAQCGDPEAIRYIVDHCEKDVEELKRLYYKLKNFAKPTDRSL